MLGKIGKFLFEKAPTKILCAVHWHLTTIFTSTSLNLVKEMKCIEGDFYSEISFTNVPKFRGTRLITPLPSISILREVNFCTIFSFAPVWITLTSRGCAPPGGPGQKCSIVLSPNSWVNLITGKYKPFARLIHKVQDFTNSETLNSLINWILIVENETTFCITIIGTSPVPFLESLKRNIRR